MRPMLCFPSLSALKVDSDDFSSGDELIVSFGVHIGTLSY